MVCIAGGADGMGKVMKLNINMYVTTSSSVYIHSFLCMSSSV